MLTFLNLVDILYEHLMIQIQNRLLDIDDLIPPVYRQEIF